MQHELTVVRRRALGSIAGCAFALGVVALACSSSTASSTNITNPSNSEIESAAEACGLSTGTKYTTHYTAPAASPPGCMTPPDDTSFQTFDASDGGAQADAGIACTTTISGCTITSACSGESSGFAVATTLTEMITTSGATGTTTTQLTEPDGGVFQSCTFTFTVTKQ